MRRMPAAVHIFVATLMLLLGSQAFGAVVVDTEEQAITACENQNLEDRYNYCIVVYVDNWAYAGYVTGSLWGKNPPTSTQGTQYNFRKATPSCDPPSHIDDSGNCVEPMTPEQCDELGMAYDGHAMACVDLEECPNGAFGDGSGSYTCLTDVTEPDEPNESDDPNTDNNCTSDSSDYKGVFNGKFYCNSNLPEAPTCKEGTSHIVDNGNGSYGFACAAMPESPDDAQGEDTETTSVIEDDDKKIERTVNSKTGAVTTKTTDKNTGEVTVTTTYPGVDSQTGKPCTEDSLYCYKSDQTGFCKDGNSLCEDVRDIKNWLTDGDSPGEGKDKGEFDDDLIDQKIADAQDKLDQQLDQIKSEFGQIFDFSPATASLSCPYTFDILGTEVALCPDQYKEQLQIIGQMIMLIAALLCFFMLARPNN